jgi:hypothetical protein
MAKVRIRKAGPGETPGYYNKTAMFLKKAQIGMQVEAQEGMNENLEVYYQYAYGQLVNDVSVDDVFGDLVQNGLPKQVAYKLVMNLMDQLVDEGKVNPQDSPKAKQEEEQPQEEQQEQPAEEPAQEEEDQSMYEEDQDMEDLEEGYLQDRSYMQDGGVSEDDEEYIQDDTTAQSQIMDQYNDVQDTDSDQFDMNELIANTPGIQPGFTFPDLESYAQDYVPTQWENTDFLQSQSEQSFPENLESQRTGGIIKKKHFVKNVMALLKKQEGGEGEGEEDKKDKGLGKGNPMDTFTGDVQKRKSSFIGAIKSNADKSKAEEMYEKLRQSNDPKLQQMGMQSEKQFQMGGYTGGQDPLFRFLGGGEEMQEDPGYYEADFLPEAKYGYSTGNLRRADKGDAGKEKSGMDLDPGFSINPATNKPWTRAEWEESKRKGKADAEQIAKERAWIQQQMTSAMLLPNATSSSSGIPKATVRYVPNYITGPGSFFNTVLPWNPLYRSRKFTAQIGSPYLLGTKTAYKDPLSGLTPVARHVHKRGILGRPKVWTDIYSMPGQMVGAGNKDIVMTGNTIVMPQRDKQGKADIITKDETELNRSIYSNTEGLKGSTKRAIRRGERRTARQVARGMEEFPEDVQLENNNVEVVLPQSKQELIKRKPSHSGISSVYEPEEVKQLSYNAPAQNIPQYNKLYPQGTSSSSGISSVYEPDMAVGGMIPPFAFAYGGYLPAAQDGLEFTVTDAQGNAVRPADNYRPPQPPTKPDLSNWDSMDPTEKFFAIRTMSTTPQMFTQEELDKYMLTQPSDDEMQMMNQEVPAEPLRIPQQRYGGLLKANNGLTINNPNLPQPGPGNPDLLVSDKPGFIGNAVQGTDSFWAQQQSFNPAAPTSSTVQAYNADPANNMKVQPALQKQPKKDENELVGVNYGRMKSKTTDPEAMVNVFNAGVRGVTGFLNRRDEKKRERQMYDNLTSDNLYASQATKHRGDWVDVGSQMGQYRFDQMGQDRSGFSSYGKFGGYMQDGGSMDYNEGDEVYMTDDELKDFLKKGGQVEYL